MIPHSKVFVGGLPSGSKPHELRRLFENYGVVTECDIMNRCGFVHMETPQMAETAIRGLHNTTFKGSVITVEPGRPKERNAGPGGGAGGGMRRGGSAPGPDRRMNDRGGVSSGPPRSGYGPPQGGREDESGLGPIRRDRGGGGGGGPRRGSEPYNRAPRGGGGFQDFQSGGGGRGRNFDGISGPGSYNSSPRNSYGGGGNMSGGPPNYGSGGGVGSFGAVNQDKRGFALPAQDFRGGRGAVNHGGRGNPFNRPMPTRTDAGAGGSFGNPNPFARSGGRGPVDSNSGRPGGDRSVNRFRAEPNTSGGVQGDRNFSLNQNYNESFPPLGATTGQRGGFRGRGGGGPRGGGFGRGGAPPNRNGPPRGGGVGMMNRYQ